MLPLLLLTVLLASCGGMGETDTQAAGGGPAGQTEQQEPNAKEPQVPSSGTEQSQTEIQQPVEEHTDPPADVNPPAVTDPAAQKNGHNGGSNGNTSGNDSGTQPADHPNAKQVVANPSDITVLVNKTYALPEGYVPDDLVEPDVPFIFKEKLEKRKMRKEAAEALEHMFAAAKEDGIYLAGVSGYRSHSTQKALFQRYVEKDGEEAARKYSAEPGHSEHETGLAMDVSGSDGKCAAEDCFAGTKEALWLEQHAHEFGFIIRYPKGKESVTGYQYEPWHLRYVGKDLAKEIAEKGITLEEYFGSAVPVSK